MLRGLAAPAPTTKGPGQLHPGPSALVEPREPARAKTDYRGPDRGWHVAMAGKPPPIVMRPVPAAGGGETLSIGRQGLGAARPG